MKDEGVTVKVDEVKELSEEQLAEKQKRDEQYKKDRLTITKKGDGYGLLIGNDVSIKYNDKEMMSIRSININMDVESALLATVEIVDGD